MRALIVLGLAAVELVSGGAFVAGSHAGAPLGRAQITARAAAAARLVDDGLGRTIDQPAIVGAIKLPGTPPTAAATHRQRSTQTDAAANTMGMR
jgi:hypothetical protein